MNFELPPTPIPPGTTPVDFLAERSGLSKQKIKSAMTKGAVWLHQNKKQKRLRRAKAVLPEDAQLAMYYSESVLATEVETPTLISDCDTYSVWIKPVGVMSGGSRFGDHCAIDRVVERQWSRPTFLVHRLDRWVWGILLLAHSKQMAALLSSQFQERQVTKIYHAIVHGQVLQSATFDQLIDDRPATTHITPITANAHQSLLEVDIETGRKHQIRRHLAGNGLPIVGDTQYGHADDRPRIQLAAVKLSFVSPVSGEVETYSLPDDQRPKL